MVNEKGFTLIELLVVIAIIGILAAVSITAYIGVTKKAARSEAYSNLESLKLLEEQFYAENGNYTASVGVCAANNPNNVTFIQQGGNPAVPANALPGFKPGNAVSFSYCIQQNLQITNIAPSPPATAALNPCFVVFAYGNINTRVVGDVFAIDCNNIRNF
ncbi:MAG TPA: prepilin-type N-terminal cleavage/methylation domain-containing protein [Nitrospirae bacterium]|nr:prepilin-type N-terminal cleavage/methylation domain-containing protein [Nitrospirota bacterium]